MKTLFASVCFCFFFALGLNAQEVVTMSDKSAPEPTYTSFSAGDIHAYTYQRLPAFLGGEEALTAYLDSNVEYPKMARKYMVEGTVTLRLTISQDGEILAAEPLTNIGFGLEEEAVRLAEEMPRWLPGIQGVQAVKCKVNLPIRFNLQ